MADQDAAHALARSGKVAILSHSHPSLTKGGAEIAAQTLFGGLRAIGIDAIMICACPEEKLDIIDLGPNEYALPYRANLYDHFYHIAAASVRAALVEMLRREQVVLLNAHHFLHVGVLVFGDVAAAGIKVVYTAHEFLAICHNHGQLVTRGAQALCDGPTPAACRACYPEHSRQQFAIRQQRVSAALSSVQAIVSPSRFLGERMIAAGVPGDRVTVIENGISVRPLPSVLASTSDRRIWKFGYFGQINPFKGVDVLLEACALISRDPALAARVRILIHGSFVGQSKEWVERFMAATREFRFLRYVGPYDNRHVGQLMAASDYVVLPSTWWENSPVVIQEAYYAKRPVICTGIGGMAEKVIHGVTGLHFSRNDASDLVDQMEAAADPSLYQRLRAGLPDVHSPTQMAERYLTVFNDVLSNPPEDEESRTSDHGVKLIRGDIVEQPQS